MVELYILGPTEIRNREGTLEHSFLAGPKRLALLVYFLLHRPHGFHRRDSLLPLFWPEGGQKSARNALSNMLYHIRRTLGSESIINRGSEEIKIRPESFWSDVVAFEECLKSGDIQKALELYRGDLLKGFFISDAAPEFDHWLEQERNRLRVLATEGAWALAEKAEADVELQAAQHWGKKAASLNPLCDQTHARLLELLDRTRNWKEAMDVYHEFTSRLLKEWESKPAAELTALAKEIQSRGPSSLRPKTTKASAVAKKIPREGIAVLPFETLGQEKATAFTDAIHGDLLTRLSNVADLAVTSRTSVMQFRNSERLLPQIAHALGVEWILGGEVQEAANQIQVNVRLVLAKEDRQVWAESYRNRLTTDNLFQIQAEITKQITTALEARLTRKEAIAIQQSPTQDLESYCLHAQGRWSLDQRTEEGMRKAVDYFRQAIARDAHYALALVGLADALILLYEYGHASADEVLPEAEKAVRQALNLAPDLAEINASAALLHEARWEGPEAESRLKRAIELRPGYAEAHNWLSWLSQLLGMPEQALQSAKRAVKLNPLSLEALSNLSLSSLTNGDYEAALREARRIQHIQAEWTNAPFLEGVTLYHQERFNEAIGVLKNLPVPWAGCGALLTLAMAYIRTEEIMKARPLQVQFRKDSNYFAIALLHATLGEREEAFEALEKIKNWDYWSVLSMHHLFPQELGPLRLDARFAPILYRVRASWGLEPKENGRKGDTEKRHQLTQLP